MKTFLFIFMFWFFTGLTPELENNITLYTIPSYKVEVNGYANFQETGSSSLMAIPAGKRDIHVVVISSYPHGSAQATVWLYSLDSLELLGPYTLTEGNVLSEEIDFKAWGALIESDEDILASVWIGGSSQPPSYDRNFKTKGRLH